MRNAGSYAVDVNSEVGEFFDAGLRVRDAGLLIASLIVPLILQFQLVTLSSAGGAQIRTFEPRVRRTANLLYSQAICPVT